MKRIGIPGWSIGDAYGVTKPYMEYFSRYGKVMILSPEGKDDEVEKLDLLVLPGGMDVAPASYGETPSFYVGNTDPFKQYFLEHRLEKYIRSTPVFGICLGMQQINVHFGGTLYQHVNLKTSGSRDERVNTLSFTEVGNAYFKHPKDVKVNSLHHQAVKRLGGGLVTLAIDSDSKAVEVLKHETLPVWGVQYHPEELGDDKISNYIIKLLLCVD